MPNCFQLARKSDIMAGAVPLAKIDGEICQHLGREVHPKLYVNGWFDYIGFRLSCGKSFADIAAEIAADLAECERQPATDVPAGASYDAADLQAARLEYYRDMAKICDFLAANFVADSWVEIGRRK